jgi:hypothetical protein
MFRKRLDNQLCNDYEPDCEDYWLADLEDKANKGEACMKAWEDMKQYLSKRNKQYDTYESVAYENHTLMLMQELTKKYHLGE